MQSDDGELFLVGHVYLSCSFLLSGARTWRTMAKATSRPCDELSIRATRPVPACAARKEWVLAAAVLGTAMSFIDESDVNVALPDIESSLHTIR